MDWNDQKYAEIWRQGWADTANRYLVYHWTCKMDEIETDEAQNCKLSKT